MGMWTGSGSRRCVGVAAASRTKRTRERNIEGNIKCQEGRRRMGTGKLENEHGFVWVTMGDLRVLSKSCRWAYRTLVGLVRDVEASLANLHVITKRVVGTVYRMIHNSAWVEDGGSEGEKRRKERKEKKGEGRTENIVFHLSGKGDS
jgi:hypothetical protein